MKERIWIHLVASEFQALRQTLALLCMKRNWINRVACETVKPNVRSTSLLGGGVGGSLSN